MDKHALKRELFELSHFIFNISVDILDSDYDREIQPRLNMALKRLCDLKIRYNRYTAEEIANNCASNDRYKENV